MAVTPRPTTTPSLTMSVPTEGLVAVRPRLRRDRRMAAAMKRRSASLPAPSAPRPPCAMGLVLVLVAPQLAEHLVEILGLAEIAVDRGEAHIGDVVYRL